MEPEYMRIIDKYAGKHGKTIFWLFILLGVGALLTPILINLRNIWENVDWISQQITGEPLASLFVSLISLVFLLIVLLGFAWVIAIFLGVFIRTSFATPTHWRLEKVLEQTIFLLQTIKMQGTVNADDMEKINNYLKNTEDLYTYWQKSYLTRFLSLITRKRGERNERKDKSKQ